MDDGEHVSHEIPHSPGWWQQTNFPKTKQAEKITCVALFTLQYTVQCYHCEKTTAGNVDSVKRTQKEGAFFTVARGRVNVIDQNLRRLWLKYGSTCSLNVSNEERHYITTFSLVKSRSLVMVFI